MKIKMLIAAFSIIILLPGCYTQFETVKQERQVVNEDYSYAENDRYDSEYYSDTLYSKGDRTIINNYYFDGGVWYPRHRWFYSYYYPSYYWPSVAFSYVFYDPWFYDRYWHYDPWSLWCWTPYVYYPHSYYYPSYYYPPYYGTPWYYVSDRGDVVRTKRDFGENRGRNDRGSPPSENRPDRFDGGRSGFDLPTGVGVIGTGGRSQTESGDQVRRKSRSGDDTRSVNPRSPDRSGTGRGESNVSRPDSRRERYDQPGRDRQSTPPSRDEGKGNDRGSSREETRTYTPPPPPPSAPPSSPPPSSPPPRGNDSRGGSNDSNQGSRGGNTRGGR